MSEPNLIIGALDSLGVALANNGHTWTEGERSIYEQAIELAQAQESQLATAQKERDEARSQLDGIEAYLGEYYDGSTFEKVQAAIREQQSERRDAEANLTAAHAALRQARAALVIARDEIGYAGNLSICKAIEAVDAILDKAAPAAESKS